MDVTKEIVYKKISEIKPYIRNARRNERTVALLTKIIPIAGFNVPIVIDEKNVIVKGHARYVAAIRLGMEEVPYVITHASEDDVKLDRIADNMVSQFSEWLTDSLLDELQTLDIDFDMEELDLPSFNAPLDDYTASEQTIEDDSEEMPIEMTEKAREKVRGLYYKVVCPDCGKMSFVKVEDAEDA